MPLVMHFNHPIYLSMDSTTTSHTVTKTPTLLSRPTFTRNRSPRLKTPTTATLFKRIFYLLFISIALIFLLGLTAKNSQACPASAQSIGTVNLEPTLEIPSNWNIDTPFKVVDVAMSDVSYRCTINKHPFADSRIVSIRRANGTTASSVVGNNDICASSIPGIGLRIEKISGELVGEPSFSGTPQNICNINSFTTNTPNETLSSNFDSKGVVYRVYFYKTGHVNPRVTLPAGENVFSYNMSSITGSIVSRITYANASTIMVAQPSCALQTASTVLIEMGNTEAYRIRNGSAPHIPFDIPISCEAKANAQLQVDLPPSQYPPGIIPITDIPRAAKGVGIALYQGGTLVQPGQIFPISTLSNQGGIMNIPFTAQYYAIDKKVTAGNANGNATFTLIMQ